MLSSRQKSDVVFIACTCMNLAVTVHVVDTSIIQCTIGALSVQCNCHFKIPSKSLRRFILKWKVVVYAEICQNGAAGQVQIWYQWSKYSYWRNDCNSVFLAKQQPAALWDLGDDDSYK